MSRENVEVVRRIYDAVARRDGTTPFELYAEDIVWDVSNAARAGVHQRSVSVGHEQVRETWREAVSIFGAVDFDVEELIDAGEKVLAVVRDRVVGRTSGAPVEALHYAVWTLEGGKVVRLQVFDERAQAFAAAGLSAGSGGAT